MSFYRKYTLVPKTCKIKMYNIIYLDMIEIHLLHVIGFKNMNMHYMQNPVFSHNSIKNI
jgi:hypothetical protein